MSGSDDGTVTCKLRSEWRGEAAGDWLGFSWCRVTAFWLNGLAWKELKA